MTTHKFKKGQLVAVRDSDRQDWKLRVYDCGENGRHYCIAAERECDGMPICWAQVAPAEIIWPNLFLAVDRQIIGAAAEQRDRLERQVQWLIEILYEDYGECPPHKRTGASCDCPSCDACWFEASARAAERRKKANDGNR